MASCSSGSARDRELQSGSRTVNVDTYQAQTVCILARDVCKSPFEVMGRQNRTPATIRGGNAVILLIWIRAAAAERPHIGILLQRGRWFLPMARVTPVRSRDEMGE